MGTGDWRWVLVSNTPHGSFLWVVSSPDDRCPVTPENLPHLIPLWKEFQRGSRTSNTVLMWTEVIMPYPLEVSAPLHYFWLWVYHKSVNGKDWQRAEAPSFLESCCLSQLVSESRKRRRQKVKEQQYEKKYRTGVENPKGREESSLEHFIQAYLLGSMRGITEGDFMPLHLFLFLLCRSWLFFQKDLGHLYKKKKKACMQQNPKSKNETARSLPSPHKDVFPSAFSPCSA